MWLAKFSFGWLVVILCLSYFLRVPYVFSLLVLLSWPVVGMLVIGDFHGLREIQSSERKRFIGGLVALLFALASVIALIILVPEVRTYGG